MLCLGTINFTIPTDIDSIDKSKTEGLLFVTLAVFEVGRCKSLLVLGS